MELYPLIFEPLLKEVIWGGEAICRFKQMPCEQKGIGESWEVSVLPGAVSVVSNGPLAGKTLEEVMEQDPVGFLGQSVIDRFGKRFPLLVKFIDATADLSVQVHPDDALSMSRHGTNGKTEMWYVIDALPGSRLVSGFSVSMDKTEYTRRVADGTLEDVLRYIEVKPGDVFFIPSGRVHAIGAGIFLAEIQQSSDITYRLYDYNRRDAQGQLRPLHVEEARDAIDYSPVSEGKTPYDQRENDVVPLLGCPYFKSNRIRLSVSAASSKELSLKDNAVRVLSDRLEIQRSYRDIDSFVLLVCMGGEGFLHFGESVQSFRQGMTVLLPATFKELVIGTHSECLLLETYV